jgi:hypothetical protein
VQIISIIANEDRLNMLETTESMQGGNANRNFLVDSLNAGKINIQRLVNANAAESSSTAISGIIQY